MMIRYLPNEGQNQYVMPEQLRTHIGETVEITGCIHKIRVMSGFAFVILRTRRQMVQCVTLFTTAFREGMFVAVKGEVAADERSRAGYEVRIHSIRVLAEPEGELPIVIHQQDVAASLDTLLDLRPVTVRNPKQRAIFRIQEGIERGFRTFLSQEQFAQIHSPKIVYQGAEGGANMFGLSYFGKEAFLAQSPQFYKQMMVGAYDRVYEIGPVFRAEKHDTSRHLSEYTSVDFEMGFIDSFEDICRMETRMIQAAVDLLKEEYQEELALWKVELPCCDVMPMIRFDEAKEWVAKAYHAPITDPDDFDPEEEKRLSELIKKQTGSDFVFVTHYHSDKRPFYAMDDPAEPHLTLSFDLLFRGLEITTGGQRVHNYAQQVAKMRARGMDPEAFSDFLMAHKAGLPPHGGLGLGLERMTARLLKVPNLRQATLFPRDTHRLTP